MESLKKKMHENYENVITFLSHRQKYSLVGFFSFKTSIAGIERIRRFFCFYIITVFFFPG